LEPLFSIKTTTAKSAPLQTAVAMGLIDAAQFGPLLPYGSSAGQLHQRSVAEGGLVFGRYARIADQEHVREVTGQGRYRMWRATN